MRPCCTSNHTMLTWYEYLLFCFWRTTTQAVGIALGKSFHYDLTRAGIALYGGHFNTKLKTKIHLTKYLNNYPNFGLIRNVEIIRNIPKLQSYLIHDIQMNEKRVQNTLKK